MEVRLRKERYYSLFGGLTRGVYSGGLLGEVRYCSSSTLKGVARVFDLAGGGHI